MIIIYLFSILLIFSNIFFVYKYIKLKKGIVEYKDIGTGRLGFYQFNYSSYVAYVYVNEIDRYSDGYSSIKINKIEPIGSSYRENLIEHTRNNFVTLKKTIDIEWLESEDNIKRLRKEKLDQLNKI